MSELVPELEDQLKKMHRQILILAEQMKIITEKIDAISQHLNISQPLHGEELIRELERRDRLKLEQMQEQLRERQRSDSQGGVSGGLQ